jgi:hypothetical protein
MGMAAPAGPNREPAVFIVGCARSGTTLLRVMLDCHPALAIANDSHFVTRAIEAQHAEDDPPLTPELVAWFESYHRTRRLRLPPGSALRAASNAHRFSDFARGIFHAYAGAQGKASAGEKAPDYVRALPLLHRLFPSARFVHVVRDGRDVALSMLEWAREGKGPGAYSLWQEHPIAMCALWWEWNLRSGRAGARELPPGTLLELRYEALVADPASALREVAAFLGLPFAPEMLDYQHGRAQREPGFAAKSTRLPPTPGLRDWHSQLSQDDQTLFEAIAGDLLRELGYSVTEREIPAEAAALAARCRAWWERELARHRSKVARGRPAGSFYANPSA